MQKDENITNVVYNPRKRPLLIDTTSENVANDSFDTDGDIFVKRPNISTTPSKLETQAVSKKRSPKILVENKTVNSNNQTQLFDDSFNFSIQNEENEKECFSNLFKEPVDDFKNHVNLKLPNDHQSEDFEESNDSFDIPVKLTINNTKQLNDPMYDSFDETSKDGAINLIVPAAVDSGVEGFPSLNNPVNRDILRIIEIEKDDHTLTLQCVDMKNAPCTVYLQGMWFDTIVDKNMKIRIIGGKRWAEKDWLINDDDGIVITDPSTLVPCTAIASSSWCARKNIIGERFKTSIEPNKAMLIGCIVHELFQVAVQCPDPSKITNEWIFSLWRENISKDVMESFVALSFSPRSFETELKPYAEVIVKWVKSHIPNKTKLFCKPMNLPTGNSIKDIHDIEENIWESLLGVKGKIDSTLLTSDKGKDIYEALELKTGKSKQSLEHGTQVLLYCLMLSIRYKQSINPGSLLYLKDGVNRVLKPKAIELKGILHQRNNLSYYYSKKDKSYPEPKRDPHFCGKCDHALTCSMMQVNSQSTASSMFQDFAQNQLSHLNSKELQYFEKWLSLINLEWNNEIKSQPKLSRIWNEDPDTREAKGNCAAFMTYESVDMISKKSFLLKFSRDTSIPDNVFQAGCMCSVSGDGLSGILLSSVYSSDSNHITLRCERPVKVMKIGSKYSLDIYNSFSTFSSTLGNIANLMRPDELSTRHRRLIVDLEPPMIGEADLSLLPLSIQSILYRSKLNEGQRNAVLSSLFTNDYSLIEGLPGTGKTTTIAVLVRCLMAQGKSVLITSYTNSAVDNIVLKLLEVIPEKNILRLGNEKAMRPEVQRLSLSNKLISKECEESYKEMRKILKDTPIVCCTCHHTSREILFSWRKFDTCIVDEASMVLEPVVLSALATSSRFILVGDAKQLCPLVHDSKAKSEGMSISLFEKLSTHKSAVFSLVAQYRMNERISSIAGSLYYENRMICGSEKVRNGTIKIAKKDFPTEWLRLALSSEIDDSCVFVDTESEKNANNEMVSKPHGNVYNIGEGMVIKQIVESLIENNIPSSCIGVMCVYRKQVDVIKQLVQNDGLEVNTVDQFQGRDKPVIIWSIVWTEGSRKKCELLTDERRINVALTRAKQKMIFVGCLKSIESLNTMKFVKTHFKTCTI